MRYISVDVETSSTIPNIRSLLSVGAVDCYDQLFTFHGIISKTTDPDLFWDDDTYKWWQSQEEARHRLDALAPTAIPRGTQILNVADDFYGWLQARADEELMFVGWPASFDYPFVQLLFQNAGLVCPFSYRTIDVKSYAVGKCGVEFNCSRDELPEFLQDKPEFPHDALSDAMCQAIQFRKLLEYEGK